MSSFFVVSQTNPNNNGACICHREGAASCRPPYAVFPAQELDAFPNAHVVACTQCLGEAYKATSMTPLDEKNLANATEGEKFSQPIKEYFAGTPVIVEPTQEDLAHRAALAVAAEEDSEPEPFRDGETGEAVSI